MNENIIPEDVRVLVKKLNMKISFFKPEDQKDTAEGYELWRIGGFEIHGFKKDDIRKLLADNEIDDTTASNDKIIDVLIPVPIIKGHSPAELLELFMVMDNSSEDKIEENVDAVMRIVLKDMAVAIEDEGVDKVAHLNLLVKTYNELFERFQQEFWTSESTKGMDKAPFMELFRTSGLYYKFYKNVVEPQIREAYPHWWHN